MPEAFWGRGPRLDPAPGSWPGRRSSSGKYPLPTVHGEPVIRTSEIGAVIFDMDGVVTDTAVVHAAAWKRLFDEFLRSRVGPHDAFEPFDVDADYLRYVDGKPRYDGVRSFLASRDIVLPEGDPSDPPDRETICGLGNRKDKYFLTRLREEPAHAYPSTTQAVRDLADRGVRTAIISASRNMSEVLASAGLSELFEVRVDGVMADAATPPGQAGSCGVPRSRARPGSRARARRGRGGRLGRSRSRATRRFRARGRRRPSRTTETRCSEAAPMRLFETSESCASSR